MAEKGFKQNSDENNDVMRTLATGHTQPTQPTGRPPKQGREGYYRFNLSMPLEYRDYLKQAAYDASTPNNIVTITEYICNLIRADMEANHGKK